MVLADRELFYRMRTHRILEVLNEPAQRIHRGVVSAFERVEQRGRRGGSDRLPKVFLLELDSAGVHFQCGGEKGKGDGPPQRDAGAIEVLGDLSKMLRQRGHALL